MAGHSPRLRMRDGGHTYVDVSHYGGLIYLDRVPRRMNMAEAQKLRDWLDCVLRQAQRSNCKSVPPADSLHSGRDGHGRQPPAVANVDRSNSAESKDAQS